jgi:non-specific serine/threonine protein kinase
VVLFRREGKYWTIAERDSILRLKDMKGLHYLTHLLRSPTREFRALDLISTTAEIGSAPRNPPEATIDLGGPGALDLTGPGALLDDTAAAHCRNRLDALRKELGEAERFNDSGRADVLRSEVEALTEQLVGTLGLGGKDRSSGSSSERARLTVTKGINAVMRKIGASNPRLGRYLASHVRTGYLCSYTPDADRPIRWRF